MGDRVWYVTAARTPINWATAFVDAANNHATAQLDIYRLLDLPGTANDRLTQWVKAGKTLDKRVIEKARFGASTDPVPAAFTPPVQPPSDIDRLRTDIAEQSAATDSALVTKAPLSALASAGRVSGRRVAFVGDSITVGTGSTNVAVDSFVAYTSKILGTAKVPTAGAFARINAGVAGETAGAVNTRMADVIALDPDAYVVMVGMNASTSLAAFTTGVQGILDKIAADGRPVVLCTVTPRSSGAAAADHERVNTYNLILRAEAAKRRLPLADTHAALVDPATGYLAAAYVGSDTTHPNAAGHKQLAVAVAAVLDPLLPDKPSPFVIPGAPGLASNPLMAGGNSTTAPTNWPSAAATSNGGALAGGTVAPTADDNLPAGAWFFLTLDASAATGTSTAVRHHNLSGSHAAGDRILVACAVMSSEPDGSGPKVTLANGSTDIATVAEQVGVQRPGLVLHVITLAAATTALRIRYSVTAAVGTTRTAYLGACQAWNLTQLGLADAF